MVTALEVLDTAVKIGLGAAISGTATYLVSQRTHTHELRKIRLQEETKLMRDALEKVNRVVTTLNLLDQEVHHLRRHTNDENSVVERNELRKQYSACFNDVKDARSICVLLGYATAAEVLIPFTDLINELNSYQCDFNRDWDKVKAAETRDGCIEAGNLFADELCKAYRLMFV